MKVKDHSCKHLLVSLSDYVDGDLNEDICAEIERHLSECHDCTVVVNTLKKTVELYHTTAEPDPLPEAMMQRLYVRLNLEDYMAR